MAKRKHLFAVTVHYHYLSDGAKNSWLPSKNTVNILSTDDLAAREKAIKRVVSQNGGADMIDVVLCETRLISTIDA